MLYPEFFGYFVGIFVGFSAEFDLLFDRLHKKLIVGVLINHAHLFIPLFALFTLLSEFVVYILQNHAASRLFKTGNKS